MREPTFGEQNSAALLSDDFVADVPPPPEVAEKRSGEAVESPEETQTATDHEPPVGGPWPCLKPAKALVNRFFEALDDSGQSLFTRTKRIEAIRHVDDFRTLRPDLSDQAALYLIAFWAGHRRFRNADAIASYWREYLDERGLDPDLTIAEQGDPTPNEVVALGFRQGVVLARSTSGSRRSTQTAAGEFLGGQR